LIEVGEYGKLKEEMLREQLVVSIRDLSLSEKLQTDPELTLERVKTMIRQKAAAKSTVGSSKVTKKLHLMQQWAENIKGEAKCRPAITDYVTTEEEPTNRCQRTTM